MEMLKNYGTKENPKDRVLKILISAKKVCSRYVFCDRECPYHCGVAFKPCVLRSTSVQRPDTWYFPWEQDRLLEIVNEPEASLVLDSIKSLSLEERKKYRIWRC